MLRVKKSMGRGAHRNRVIAAFAAVVVAIAIAVPTFFTIQSSWAAPSWTKTVDTNTMTTWKNFTGDDSTENVGRVWTDKTVADNDVTLTNNEGTQTNIISKDSNADFLVGLSALSSTSNVSTTTTSYQPLDIVLVLDVSGSMAENMTSYTYEYTAVDSDDVVESSGRTYTDYHWWFGEYQHAEQLTEPNETYYVQIDDGEYAEVTENTRRVGGELGTFYNDHISWTTEDGTVVDPNTTTFYTRRRTGQTTTPKITALKTAVNGFITQTNNLNSQLEESQEPIQIAIVKYAGNTDDAMVRYPIGDDTTGRGEGLRNYTQVVSDFTDDAESLTNDVNGLSAGGATAADAGLELASNVLEGGQHGRGDNRATYQGARENAQKVVIFFTDGEPNHSSGFDAYVANDAIDAAGAMKGNNTTIYSVGIFSGADPDNTSTGNSNRTNAYMHGVSSNYPGATGWNSLGAREPNSDYYKAANDAEGLSDVFRNIFDESTSSSGSGSPIEDVESGGQSAIGTLDFEDQLGGYMEITPNTPMTLVYGNQEFQSNQGVTSLDSSTVTYTFTGRYTANGVYGEADLSTITVTVTKGDLATGDNVKISLPASLIPMRTYNVNRNDNSLSVTDAYPVRLFYNVSLKEDARDAVQNPVGDNAQTYQAILSAQADPTSDSISFLSNAWSSASGVGTTTAQFTPNQANNFYYFTSDTPLYTDPDCADEHRADADDVETHDRLYYRTTYWESGDNGTTEVHNYGTVTSEGVTWSRIDTSGDQAYIPRHTPRLDKPATMVTQKGDGNLTETAGTVLSPSWTNDNTVQQNLGNNGELSYPKPGELEIKKTVDWGNASESTKANKNSFTFTVDLKQVTTGEDGTETETDLTGSYPYAVYGASGDTPVSSGTIADDGTVTISADQRVVISGLPSGVRYTVTETVPNGFTVSDSSTGDGASTTDGIVAGAIVAGSQQSVSFKNTYHADGVNLRDANATLSVQKVLNGRDWRDSDTFKFDIAGSGSAPMPEDTSVYVNDADSNHTASFGDITFEAPGTYTYTVSEDNDYQPIAGVNYSAAQYTVTVTVQDDGEGKLYIADDGVAITQTAPDVAGGSTTTVSNNTMVFTNTYSADEDPQLIDGVKVYNDTTGGNPITEENKASKFQFRIEAVGGFVTEGGSAENPTIDAEDVPMPTGTAEGSTSTTTGIATITQTGGTFRFPAINFTGDHAGNTYVYTVSEVQGTEQGMDYSKATHTLKIEVKEVTDDSGTHIVATPNLNPAEISFTNTYNPDDATLTGDDAIHGTKTLTGRNMLDGETFYFQLKEDGANPASVLDEPVYAKVTGAQDGFASPFKFGDMTFSKTGKYVFYVNEVANTNGAETENGEGLTFDQNIAKVTVDVTDPGTGTLKATVKYENQGHDEADRAVFANTYEASMNYGAEGAGGITITKQMNGRPLTANEFEFTITGNDDKSAEKLADTDKRFTNSMQAAAGRTVSMRKFQSMTFDQNDAGETFSFTVAETKPAENALPGVVYDQSTYTVTIKVFDDGDGSMHTLTTVVKHTPDADDATIVDQARSDIEGYTAPSFGFVNSYDPEPAELTKDAKNNLQVTKTVEGAPSPEGVSYEFTLRLTSNNGQYVTGLTNGSATVKTSGVIAAGDSRTLGFPDLTFSRPGTYTFTVQETEPDARPGWSYDTNVKNITVVVTDLNKESAYDGNLYIDEVRGNPAQVTNTYTSGSVDYDPTGSTEVAVNKVVAGNGTGDQMSPEGYTFELAVRNTTAGAEEDAGFALPEPKTATSGSDGAVKFADGITFTAEGTYEISINEVTPDPAADHMTYDTHTFSYTVSVTDEDYDGTLEVAVVEDSIEGSPTFTNVYYDEGNAKDVTTETGDTTTSVDGEMVSAGDTLTYSIDWASNAHDENGNPVSSTITIVDEVPAGVTVDQDSITNQGVYDANAGTNGTITWTLENQAFGTAGTVSFSVTVDDPTDGAAQIENDATVKVGDNEYTTNETHNTVPGKEETTDPGNITAGDTLSYKITFYGGDENGSAQVVDTMTAGQEYADGSARVTIGDGEATQVDPDVAGTAADGQTLTWNIDNIPANELVTITFDVTITRDAGTSVDNTATVNGHETNTTTTPYPSDDKKDVFEADDPTTSVNGKLVGVGDTLTYTIDWAADEDGTVTITDELPRGTAYVESSASEPGVYDEGTRTISWELGEQAAGERGTVSFQVTVTNDAVQNDPITNTASIQIGENDPKQVTAEVDIPKKTAEDQTPDTGYQVGDTIHYTIEWANHEDSAQTVTITDTLPEGLTYVDDTASRADDFTANGQTLTWTFEAEPGDAGTVSFDARINEQATVVEDPVTNSATVEVGDNSYNTNTTDDETEVETGSLSIKKTVAVDESTGASIDKDKVFEFTVALAGTDSEPLTGEYAYTVDGGDEQALDLNNEGKATIELTHGQTATITGLPEGASYAVTEADYSDGGYTTTVPDNANGTIATDGATVEFINTYSPGGTDIGGESDVAGITVQKTFTGRENGWGENDSFQFTLTPADNAPMPEGEGADTITIGKPESGNENTNVFGAIEYNAVGEYHYTISEVVPADDDNAELDGKQQDGVTYDTHTANVTVSVTDDDHDGKLEASVSYDNDDATTPEDQAVEDAAAFTNTYAPSGETTTPDAGEGSIMLRKVLTGRDWAEGETFTFSIAAGNDEAANYLPDPATATVSEPTGTDDNGNVYADFVGWTITYDQPGTYVYTVTEVPGETPNPGIAYDGHTATVTVRVTDNNQGGYTAVAEVKDGTFTNKYQTGTVNYDAEGGLQIVKNLTGHDIAAGQFQFTLTATNDDAIEKLGGKTRVYDSTPQATSGNVASETIAALTNMTFDQSDAGKTFTFTMAETKGGGEGYTNDTRVYEIEIAVTDNTQGTLTVTTTVDGETVATYTASAVATNALQPVTLEFNNSYDAGTTTVGEGTSATIEATKTLTGRPMTADEFTFTVTDAKGNEVTTGSNAAAADGEAGAVTFGDITYTVEKLNNDATNGIASKTAGKNGATVYTYQYTVTETGGTGDGVASVANSFPVTVTVTDDGAGHLTAAVDQGENPTLGFTNTYGDGETADAVLNGNKAIVLADPTLTGPTLADIAGKYTFTLTGVDGAPMPEGSSGNTLTAQNDAAGGVYFGTITYTMANVFGESSSTDAAEGDVSTQASEPRSKTFTYEVTESGEVAGITNEGGTKTIEVTVTDNGDGTLSVDVAPASGAAEGMDFTFTNKYDVEDVTTTPTGEGGVTITKTLDGRTMDEGEFTFQMVETGATEPVATATNGANGSVNFGGITFTQPGTYTYEISEVPGEQSNGVSYDRSVYTATAVVTDTGTGTLSVEWTVKNAAGEEVEQIEFANGYTTTPASATFGGSKVLNGATLEDGQFSFRLSDAEGNEVQTVQNAADGSFVFDTLTFDAPGTYEYTISEVLPEDDDATTDGIQQDGVTYDEATWTVEVTVSDNRKGQLTITGLTYNGETEFPVFTNTYTEPPAPEPDDDNEGPLMQTSDGTFTAIAAVLGLGVVSIAAGVVIKKRGE